MTSKARPRGPLPARVYWVRRTLVLALALGLVFGVSHLLGRTADDGSGQAARVVGGDPTSAGPSSALPTDDARPGQDGTRKPRRKQRDGGKRPKETEPPLAIPTGPCRNGEVVVKPKLRDPAVAGRVVHFRLKLTTTETPACTWTVSPETLVVKVTSGEDRIWSSQDCPAAVPQTDVVVRKDVPAKIDMGWRGQRSDSECSRLPGWAQPGFYHVQTAAYGAEPIDVQFELEPPVAPTRTAKPKPDKTEKQRDDEQQQSPEER